MNKDIFKSLSSKHLVKSTNTSNKAGGVAYKLSSEKALAQLACTGTFNGTYYSSGEETLEDVLRLVQEVSPLFHAKLTIYSFEFAFMKDSSALLLATLMGRDNKLFKAVFPRVVRNGKTLRNFCQAVRSGVTGKKSFGSSAKKMIQSFLNYRTDTQLLEDSVGNDPTLVDVIKMVHPKPPTQAREAFYAYLLGREVAFEKLPQVVQEFETFKKASKGTRKVPNVPFQMLTALDLSSEEWTEIAKTAPWHMTRMNLNTFMRHDVLKNPNMVNMIAKRLSDRDTIKKVKVFPYQLFTAYKNTDDSLPMPIKNALQDAMEVATENVPELKGKTFIGVDCSASMTASVTGNRGTATSKVSCNEVAALMAASFLRSSKDCDVYRFDTRAEKLTLNPRDTVMTNTNRIGANGGGTDCSAMLMVLNQQKAIGESVIILSDNESWANGRYFVQGTGLANEWAAFKKRNRKAKLVLVDLAAGVTTQTNTQKDVLNVGGFGNDSVFEVIGSFLNNEPNAWLEKINNIKLMSSDSE